MSDTEYPLDRHEGDSYPLILGDDNAVDLIDAVDSLNEVLSSITDTSEADPVATYERVWEVLRDSGFVLPSVRTLDNLYTKDNGEHIFEMRSRWYTDEVYFLYFGFAIEEDGFDIYAEIMDKEDLDEFLDD